MITSAQKKQTDEIERARREARVVLSALWSAAGDALGWITELSRGPSGVAYRAKTDRVTRPVDWQRTIGGRNGPRVQLPAGTYSDDTQLRLAVSRSIRGDGSFDAETFAKIEMTVWPTYALGGGLGTKAAAINLSRRSVNWFSNFFDSAGQNYVRGGGNGAAMRIQPHVWAASPDTNDALINVLRNSLITHGHPHGFCGAIFHALCLAHVLNKRLIPEPNDWRRFVDDFRIVEQLISSEPQLAAFWKSAWENDGGRPITSAIEAMRNDAHRDIDLVSGILEEKPHDVYHRVLNDLGCLSPSFRGSGFKTALAAASLAYIHGAEDPSDALVQAANELESDTDTIATMVGALLGALTEVAPEWSLQDRPYIVKEARRLASISLGYPQDSFTYPDLGHWNPPTKQTASIGWFEKQLAITGLGVLSPISTEYRVGDAIWQWLELPFGQTILAKRSANLRTTIPLSQLPGPRQAARIASNAPSAIPPTPSTAQIQQSAADERRSSSRSSHQQNETIDAWTDVAIQNGFDDLILGQMLNRCIDQSGSVDAAVAFAGIVAKAKLARERRRR